MSTSSEVARQTLSYNWSIASGVMTMQSIIQTRYQRVEKALDALIESITAYNPSQSAADELVAADEAVNQGLEDRRST